MKGHYESVGHVWESDETPECTYCGEQATRETPYAGVLVCDDPICHTALAMQGAEIVWVPGDNLRWEIRCLDCSKVEGNEIAKFLSEARCLGCPDTEWVEVEREDVFGFLSKEYASPKAVMEAMERDMQSGERKAEVLLPSWRIRVRSITEVGENEGR